MKLTIKKAVLLDAVSKAQGTAGKTNTMPILSNILMVATDTGLEVTSTDLEISIRGKYTAEVEAQGAVCCSARKLYDIVRELPAEDVKISVSESNWVSIISGSAKFRLTGMPKDEYPAFPEVSSGNMISIPASVLSEMIRKTINCVPDNDARYVLNGILLNLRPSGGNTAIRMVATDGHRLAMVDRSITGETGELKIIIPRKGMVELKKLLDGIDDESMGVQISATNSHFVYKQDGVVLITKLIDGNYPNYSQVIPKGNANKLSAQKDVLSQALKRISIIAREQNLAVKFDVKSSQLELSTKKQEVGEANESLVVNYTGPSLTLGFNVSYMLDGLSAVNGNTVDLAFNEATSPGLITSPEDPGFLYVCMPMRI